MLSAGVATRARTGRLIDRFRDRVVFPIEHQGDVLGFVGRRRPELGEDDQGGPKYLNTGATALFHKGDQLFVADPRLLKDGATPVLVEGPMDAYAVTLAGEGRYVGVAPLGTSLTEQQAAQLARISRDPIVATDPDIAGQVAAERDYWLLTPHGLDPTYARFPDGLDPADVLTQRGPSALVAALDSAAPLGQVLLEERVNNMDPAAALLESVQVLAARRPEAWEDGVQQLGERLYVGDEVAARFLRDAVEYLGCGPAEGGRGQCCCCRRRPGTTRGHRLSCRLRSGGQHSPTNWMRGLSTSPTGPPPPRCCSRPTTPATTSQPRPVPWSPRRRWVAVRPAICGTGSSRASTSPQTSTTACHRRRQSSGCRAATTP